MDIIDDLLGKPYWIIDILPKQVPRLSCGQYGKVEHYYLKDSSIIKKQLNILLKLNCYYDLVLLRDSGQIRNPEPELLKTVVGKEYLDILIGEALFVIDYTDTYMTVFGAEGEMLDLVRQLAAAEGLFIWQP